MLVYLEYYEISDELLTACKRWYGNTKGKCTSVTDPFSVFQRNLIAYTNFSTFRYSRLAFYLFSIQSDETVTITVLKLSTVDVFPPLYICQLIIDSKK